jgi:aminoglycoside phosphotransferase (APT) family kinase protein
VPGEPADCVEITDVERSIENLAGFLRALQDIAFDGAREDAPVNAGRGTPLRQLSDGFAERLRLVEDRVDAKRVQNVWDVAVGAPEWQGPAVWLHADLHPANVLVSGGAITGVIDFGEMCVGDPAVDLASAWMLLPAGAESGFFDAYGGVDQAMIDRARGWVARFALALLEVGHRWEQGLPGGKQTWGPAGHRALERVFASVDL